MGDRWEGEGEGEEWEREGEEEGSGWELTRTLREEKRMWEGRDWMSLAEFEGRLFRRREDGMTKGEG